VSRAALARLLHLSSQTLPIGGYSHSQGLASAIERQVVTDEASLKRWIIDCLDFTWRSFEIPCLLSMMAAWTAGDAARVAALNDEYLASRESRELRLAAVQMGHSLRALLTVLPELPDALSAQLRAMAEPSLPCAWSAAASAWQTEAADAAVGYLWSWAENQVLVAMKTLPLGQSAGHRLLVEVGPRLSQLAEDCAAVDPELKSNFSPGLAILSSQHETQYSRLFRS
jgi:urease accessory protein